MPPAHTTVRVRISAPSLSMTRSSRISFTPVAEPELHAEVGEPLGRVALRLLGEGAQHRRAVVDQVDVGPVHVEVAVALGHDVVHQVGQRPRGLHARRPGAHHHQVQRALIEAGRLALGVLEHPEDPGPEPVGVHRRVEREGVLLGTRRPEEVRPRAGRQHQVVACERLARRRRHRPGARCRRSATSPWRDRDRRVASGRSRGTAERCPPAPAPPSPPGRAAAGTGGSCSGRPA